MADDILSAVRCALCGSQLRPVSRQQQQCYQGHLSLCQEPAWTPACRQPTHWCLDTCMPSAPLTSIVARRGTKFQGRGARPTLRAASCNYAHWCLEYCNNREEVSHFGYLFTITTHPPSVVLESWLVAFLRKMRPPLSLIFLTVHPKNNSACPCILPWCWWYQPVLRPAGAQHCCTPLGICSAAVTHQGLQVVKSSELTQQGDYMGSGPHLYRPPPNAKPERPPMPATPSTPCSACLSGSKRAAPGPNRRSSLWLS